MTGVVVVSNTSPLNYLILVNAADVLPRLFDRVLVPPAVIRELSRPATPRPVRDWLTDRPTWLETASAPLATDPILAHLDDGEREAIVLAEASAADLLLMDERDGVRIARRRGLVVVGTLGVLDRAAELGLIDLPATLAHLQQTTFRAARPLLAALLERDAGRHPGRQPPP